MHSYFIFNNINSLDMDVLINKLPPVTKPEKDIEKIEVLGRDGFLTMDYGTYRSTIKSVECTLQNKDKLIELCKWLDGSGDIIFSNEPDKIYKATIKNQIPFDQIIPQVYEFIIQFECQPHKYSTDNFMIPLIKPGIVYNPGTCNSKPIIKVYCNGSSTLTINNNNIYLTDIVDYVTIDSQLVDCYKDTKLMNNNMNGEFPILIPGENNITWTENITKLEITPNWRWL